MFREIENVFCAAVCFITKIIEAAILYCFYVKIIESHAEVNFTKKNVITALNTQANIKSINQ